MITREELIRRIGKLINESNKPITGAICFLLSSEGEVGVGFFNVCDKHIDCFLPILEEGVRLIELHVDAKGRTPHANIDESLN